MHHAGANSSPPAHWKGPWLPHDQAPADSSASAVVWTERPTMKRSGAIRRGAHQLERLFGGDFRLIVYVNTLTYAEHIALVKGNITGDDPVLVRMQQQNVLDMLGDASLDSHDMIERAMLRAK